MEGKSKIRLKDVYESLWKCRDFELLHLWQRSIVLTLFLVMCFIGVIFSCLWIMMGKGSKAWYEIYENAITAISKITRQW